MWLDGFRVHVHQAQQEGACSSDADMATAAQEATCQEHCLLGVCNGLFGVTESTTV